MDTGTEVPHPLHPRPLVLGTPTSKGAPLVTTTTPPDGGNDFRGEAFGAEGEKREKKTGGDNGIGGGGGGGSDAAAGGGGGKGWGSAGLQLGLL